MVNYPSMFELVQDLRNMGENNAVCLDNNPDVFHDHRHSSPHEQTFTRSQFLSNETLVAAAAAYYGGSQSNHIQAFVSNDQT